MLSTFKLPVRFDPEPLKTDLDVLAPGDWTPHFNTGYYEGEWSGAALRSVGGRAGELYPDPTAQDAFAATPLLDRCPNIQRALSELKCETESVRLLKLGAGAEIREHRDYNLGPEDGTIRLHIPVRTNPQVEFFLDNQKVVMQEGECWYLNFNLPHRVYNGGETDRVHLVIDCVVNDWLRSLVPFDADTQDEKNDSGSSVEIETPKGGFEEFRQHVLADVQLQKMLMATPDRSTFIAMTIRLGGQHGYAFTSEEVEETLRASRRAWLEKWV